MKRIICMLLCLPLLSKAQQLEITSFQSDGTLTWTNSVSNLYYGVEYKNAMDGYWNEAPAEWWNMFETGLVGSVQLPLAEIEDPTMFFRVVCSSSYIGDYYDIVSNGIPHFVSTDYIELEKIEAVSRFRSSAGHDYSDEFESCRSMKHYFQPGAGVEWGDILIRSPVDGIIVSLREEWAGTQMRIKSTVQPAFYFTIFHIALSPPLSEGDTVYDGQLLGTHIGNQTMSDIAVEVSTPEGQRLVSYFDVMEDTLFTNYIARGVSARSDLIITQAERDADPLTCDGETFLTYGTLPNWVNLSAP